MQLTLHISSLNQHWDVIHGIVGHRSVTKNTCPLKKPGISPKTGRRKSFVHRKNRPRSIKTLPKHSSDKETVPTIAFLENERQI